MTNRKLAQYNTFAMGIRDRQQGMTLIAIVLIGALVVIVGGAAMKAAPTFIEYRTIQAAVERAAQTEGGPLAIRKVYERATDIESISSVTPKDLEIEEVDGQTKVSFAYEKKVSLVGPVSLLIDYRGSSTSDR